MSRVSAKLMRFGVRWAAWEKRTGDQRSQQAVHAAHHPLPAFHHGAGLLTELVRRPVPGPVDVAHARLAHAAAATPVRLLCWLSVALCLLSNGVLPVAQQCCDTYVGRCCMRPRNMPTWPGGVVLGWSTNAQLGWASFGIPPGGASAPVVLLCCKRSGVCYVANSVSLVKATEFGQRSKVRCERRLSPPSALSASAEDSKSSRRSSFTCGVVGSVV